MNILSLLDIFLIIIHFLIKFGWAFLFFNYPTLDDIHTIPYTLIYQWDTAYHMILWTKIFYLPFFFLFDYVFAIRLANAIISSISLFIFLKSLKDGKIIFFLLFTFLPLPIERASLTAGNYATIPLFISLIFWSDSTKAKIKEIVRGFAIGISITSHPIFITFLPLLKKKDIPYFILALTPSILYNTYHTILNKTFIPTIMDILMRLHTAKMIPESSYIFFFPWNILTFLAWDLRYIIPILGTAILSTTEMQFFAPLVISYFVVSKMKVRAEIFFISLSLSFFGFLSKIHFVEGKDFSYMKNFYGKKEHYLYSKEKIDELRERFICLEKYFENRKIELDLVSGFTFSFSFFNFFTGKTISPLYNMWSDFYPKFFSGKVKFIIIAKEDDPNILPLQDLIKEKIQVCEGEIIELKVVLERKKIHKLYKKNFFVRYDIQTKINRRFETSD